MSKAFVKESDDEEEKPNSSQQALTKMKNYVTPYGYNLLQKELRHLLREERPKLVETVRWAASNGDRSENGDYIYGKKRLREIDRRMRYLTKQIDNSIIVNPEQQKALKKVFFGATVSYIENDSATKTIKIVGIDEADLTQNKISWISPLAKVLMKSQPDDIIEFQTPAGIEILKVINVRYEI